VDTGSDGSIAIPEPAFDRLEKLGFIEESPILMKTQSLNRIRDSRRGWFLKGELMGMPLRGMDVVSSARKPSTPLGLIWLSCFNFELDHQKNTMRFEQRGNPAPAPALQMMLGAVLMYDEEGARVFRIRPDGEGPFEKAGLKVGDRIVKFGELEASEIDLPNVAELIVRNPLGEIEVRYSREDGVPMETVVKLEKFISTRDFSGRDVLRKAPRRNRDRDSRDAGDPAHPQRTPDRLGEIQRYRPQRLVQRAGDESRTRQGRPAGGRVRPDRVIQQRKLRRPHHRAHRDRNYLASCWYRFPRNEGYTARILATAPDAETVTQARRSETSQSRAEVFRSNACLGIAASEGAPRVSASFAGP